MPLPEPAAERYRVHTRTILIEGYKRSDGLFDIEGRLTDTKDHDARMAEGVRRAGDPIHEMWVRLTIDEDLHIVDACAVTDAMPYAEACARITPDYAKLRGARIGPGFRNKLQALFGGLQGCTHLTELVGTMATGAVQALYGQRSQSRRTEGKPFQLDGCHALDTQGAVVARYYPQWYRGRPGS
jgi:DUF2889 family protein